MEREVRRRAPGRMEQSPAGAMRESRPASPAEPALRQPGRPLRRRLPWIALALALLTGAALLEVQVQSLQDRLRTQDLAVVDAGATISRLNESLKDHGSGLAGFRTEADRVRDELARAREALRKAEANEAAERQIISDKLAKLTGSLREDLARTERSANATAISWLNASRQLTDLQAMLHKDPRRRSQNLLRPSVQVTCGTGVGGGTILSSKWIGAGQKRAASYILTAYHVVQGALDGTGISHTPIPVTVKVYRPDLSALEDYPARVKNHDGDRDLALLEVETDRPFPCTARLASREKVAALRLFQPVYTVGCPLGQPPMPSPGEITRKGRTEGKTRYWMMSAPTIFGNSGGGVFNADTEELVGVASMVCVYEQLISIPVPHLGIFLPLTEVYAWLDSQKLNTLVGAEEPEGDEVLKVAAGPAAATEELPQQIVATPAVK